MGDIFILLATGGICGVIGVIYGASLPDNDAITALRQSECQNENDVRALLIVARTTIAQAIFAHDPELYKETANRTYEACIKYHNSKKEGDSEALNQRLVEVEERYPYIANFCVVDEVNTLSPDLSSSTIEELTWVYSDVSIYLHFKMAGPLPPEYPVF